jgi:hypothetical protein
MILQIQLMKKILLIPCYVTISLIFIIALFFRIWHIGNMPGVNGDEAWLGWKALQFLNGRTINWNTNTGNLTNVFYFLPLLALQAIFPPSFTVLRAVAVVSGVLALVINYFFCRRTFDAETAVLSTLLLAVLPINIAYSRLGWEPSQILGASVLIVYSALLIVCDWQRSRFWTTFSICAFIAAFNVHPMCVFLLPFLLLAICLRWGTEVMDILLLRNRIGGVVFWIVGVLLLTCFWLWMGGIAMQYVRYAHRAGSLPLFMLGVLRLFSGVSIYEYTSTGPVEGVQAVDIVTGLLVALVLTGGFTVWRTQTRRKTEFVLFVALVASLVLFWALLGATGVESGRTRYALWMVLPGTLLFTRAAILFYRRRPRVQGMAQGGFVLLCLMLLIGFWRQYFLVFLRTGGTGATAFQTAPTEPKLAALQLILEKQKLRRPIIIGSSDWWLFWPLHYQAYYVPELTMMFNGKIEDVPTGDVLKYSLQGSDIWIAEFAVPTTLAKLRAELREKNRSYREYATHAADGRPIVALFQVQAE